MKKLLLFVTVLLLAVPASAQEYKSAYDRVIATNALRCGYGISPGALDVDPNTGKFSGVAYDIMEEIGKILKIKIVWAEEVGWGNFTEGLRTNRYDAFCSLMWPDHARIKNLSVTRSVLYSDIFAYVRNDDTRFDNKPDSLNSDKVIIPVVDGDVTQQMVETLFPKAKMLTLPQTSTLADMILSVMTKKADIAMMDINMFRAFGKNNEGELKEVAGIGAIQRKGSNFGVNAGETQLRDMINAALELMINDGTLDKIIAKYDGLTPPKKGYEEK